MGAREDALIEVVDLVRRHGLSAEEVAAALAGPADFEATRSGTFVSRLFAYIGGTFVFAGLAIFIGMKWDDLDAIGRVSLTLGPGFCIFLLALVCTSNDRFENAATPLFLVAALLEPTGIVILLREFSAGGDPAHALMFLNFVMAVQQGCTFVARRRTVLALTTIVFASSFFAVALDQLEIDKDVIAMTIGASLVCIAWSLDRSRHRAISALVYFVGAALFLAAAHDQLRHTAAEVLFLGLTCGGVVLAVVARSRSLLLVSTAALIGYLTEFIYENFADNLGAPLLLMAIGFVLIALGAAAIGINRRFLATET